VDTVTPIVQVCYIPIVIGAAGRDNDFQVGVGVIEGCIPKRGRRSYFENNASQAGATCERTVADGCDAVGYGDARQAGAVIEHKVADGRYAVVYDDARQASTAIERSVTDGRYAVGYDETAADSVWYYQYFCLCFVINYSVNRRKVWIISIYVNARQTCAAVERIKADGRYAVGYDYASQAGATERSVANARYAVAYGDARQVG
jgi:hypothetical protein